MSNEFMGHYVDWRNKRLKAITDFYGASSFKNKTLLELGCGHAHIGKYFYDLGAEVTVCDARKEHIEKVKELYPELITYVFDANKEFPFDGIFDFIINMGLLYHLTDPLYNLKKSCESTTNLILETEVVDSKDFYTTIKVYENSSHYDQSIRPYAIRISIACIEQLLDAYGFQFERVDDDRCDSGMHNYSWIPSDNKQYRSGYRKMWFCKKTSNKKDELCQKLSLPVHLLS